MKIGITERGDAAIHFKSWVNKLDAMDGAILITKNPQKLLERINDFDTSKCIIHCTITGWGGTILEPRVPTAVNSMNAYYKFIELLGEDRVVLRVDPIIPTKIGLKFAATLIILATSRIRVSFLDMYKHVYKRFQRVDVDMHDRLHKLYGGGIHSPHKKRKEYLQLLKDRTNYDIEVCGEPGMECSGCISKLDLKILNIKQPEILGKSKQRSTCACAAVKTELLSSRRQCAHGCVYCYWR